MGHARGVLVRVDERGKENGGGGSGWRLLTARWKEGGSGAGVHVGEKEERRGAGAAVGTGLWPTGTGGWHADSWARGHSNGRRGLNRFKIFKRFENAQISLNFD
jgi:hypothetical protein